MAASVFSIFIVSISLSSIISTHADPRTDLVARACGRSVALDATKYSKRYFEMVTQMQEEMELNKFAFREAGESPDRIFVYAQCNDDLSPRDCRECFDSIKRLLPSCFPATGGRVLFDGCFIRADNYSFFQETVTPNDLWRCSDSVDKRQVFRDMAVKVTKEVVAKAVEYGGFALDEEKLPDVSVYAMANCWKPLDRDMCSSCLASAAQVLSSCLPSTEGRALNAGCVLRYSDYEFGNNPRDRSTTDSLFLYFLYLLGTMFICSLVLFIGFCAGKVIYRRKNMRRKPMGVEMDSSVLDRNMLIMQFMYSTLEKATECFNEAHKLGQGGYGEVFKGILPDGREIAVKRLFISGKRQTEEVYNEIDIISRAQHKNLLRFLGCCFTVRNSFLVYEFLANRSLDLVLFDPEKKKVLDWKKRFAIIVGTAEGLQYLHKDSLVRIIHRDIKASNILLDLKYKPKIADFGLARFYSCAETHMSTVIAGTLGYMAPEYLTRGRLTEKVDVYSFGVLILEIVSGERNNKPQTLESSETVLTRAWKHLKSDKLEDVIDKSMKIEDNEEITRALKVGLLCTQEAPTSRPTMSTVIQLLTQKQDELPVPSRPPFTDECMEFSSSLDRHRRKPSFLSDSLKNQIFEGEH